MTAVLVDIVIPLERAPTIDNFLIACLI